MGAEAAAQTPPAGARFQITSPGYHQAPAVVADPAGNFIVVWSSISGVLGRRYRPDGLPIGSQFVVTTSGSAAWRLSQPVAVRRNGEFVVVWLGGDANTRRIFGQRFRSDATMQGAVFPVSDATSGSVSHMSVATDGEDSFVAVWQQGLSIAQDIFAQRLDASGARVGTTFRVNADTSGSQAWPLVAMHPSGGFVVVWSDESGRDGSQQGVFGQRFAADGTRLGGEFQVAQSTLGGQNVSGVAVQPNGNFVVTWDGPPGDSFLRLFAADGTPSTNEFRANVTTPGWEPRVAVDESGDLVVAWLSADPFTWNVTVRGFDKTGVPRGSEVQVDATANLGDQALGIDREGNFLVTWVDRSTTPNPNVSELAGRRFRGRVPGKLQVDSAPGPSSNGNGFLEPGEDVDVRPWWWNTSGTTQAFSAGMSNATGPGNPTFQDGSAAYSIPQALVGTCTDCYRLAIDDVSPRPSCHWDVTADETLLAPPFHQARNWTFHVGRSFRSIPPSHPFYWALETLLHAGVITCAVADAQTVEVVARSEVAEVVLKAIEGSEYTPPACEESRFDDVPADAPQCAWIHELARRGIVGGCGEGRYCAARGVTRGELAVILGRARGDAPPACSTRRRFQVTEPAAAPYCRWTENAVRQGFTQKCAEGRSCSDRAVSLGELAAGVVGAFGIDAADTSTRK